jgi:hypothetical protein
VRASATACRDIGREGSNLSHYPNNRICTMKPHRILAALAIATALVAASSTTADARQYQSSGGQVVHTRRLPVILHRMVPPQYGKHVWAGRR